MVIEEFKLSERMVHHLMLQSYFINDMSMWYGQMGIAIVLSYYSQYTNNRVYLDYSLCLLNKIADNINNCKALSFSSGLLGIGWGVEYFLQKGFIEGDGVEICQSIDRNIMEINVHRIPDLSLENGVMGLLHYTIYHIQGALKIGSKLPFDQSYYTDLYNLCTTLRKKKNTSKSLNTLLDVYINFCHIQTIDNYTFLVSDFIKIETNKLDKEIHSYPLGLREGLAGILFKNMQKNETHLYI